MLYRIVRPVARYVLGYYFKHIDITGLENIPRDKAVILASNHPTAFLEPCLLACFQGRSLYFLARGDLYKTRLATTLLRALHILPVFRIQDGTYADLSRNYATFEECFGVLSKGRALMILAEGRCIHEKRLRPLRKGTARIALGALDKDPTLPEIYVVPVGVNFTAADKVRSTVMIRCGKPLLTSAYLPTYRHNEAGSLKEFTADLARAMSPLIVQLPERESDDIYETRLAIRTNNEGHSEDGITHTGQALTTSLKAVSEPLNKPWVLRQYASRLRSNGLGDRALSPDDSLRPSLLELMAAALLLLPQLPLWLLAQVVATLVPKSVEFYSPVRFAVIAIGTMLYLPVLIILPWLLKFYLLFSLVFVRWSIRRVEEWIAYRNRLKFMRLVPAEKELLQDLRRSLVD